jgi:hypothetical protein
MARDRLGLVWCPAIGFVVVVHAGAEELKKKTGEALKVVL